jgi:hypothetical protein
MSLILLLAGPDDQPATTPLNSNVVGQAGRPPPHRSATSVAAAGHRAAPSCAGTVGQSHRSSGRRSSGGSLSCRRRTDNPKNLGTVRRKRTVFALPGQFLKCPLVVAMDALGAIPTGRTRGGLCRGSNMENDHASLHGAGIEAEGAGIGEQSVSHALRCDSSRREARLHRKCGRTRFFPLRVWNPGTVKYLLDAFDASPANSH